MVNSGTECGNSGFGSAAVQRVWHRERLNGLHRLSAKSGSTADKSPRAMTSKIAGRDATKKRRTSGFLFGVPFFYGRTVFTALDGATTPGGTGPYFAY